MRSFGEDDLFSCDAAWDSALCAVGDAGAAHGDMHRVGSGIICDGCGADLACFGKTRGKARRKVPDSEKPTSAAKAALQMRRSRHG